ncbi:CenpB-DNA-bind-domain-containing protein, partial [Ceratobasidium sp. AG-I]
QPTLSRIIRQEELIRAYVAAHPERLHHKRRPLVRLPEVEAALSQWVQQKQGRNLRLTGAVLCEKARDFCHLLHVPLEEELKFSNGWLNRFKARLGLREIIFHGEAASAPLEALADERYRLHGILPLFLPRDIFNVDETAMVWKATPD